MKYITTYIKGMLEFKSSFTVHYYDYNAMIKYDMGRELMHKITLRYFE